VKLQFGTCQRAHRRKPGPPLVIIERIESAEAS
jgi:hypothetical protein